MDKPTIGIRIANGTFFPILQEDDRKRKRVILSPVRENQNDVKIDIFRGEGQGMLNPVYVASLILNNISRESGKSSEIQLVLDVTDEGVLDAEAVENVSGVKQFLSISLDSIDENADFYNMPDSDAESAAGDYDTGFSAELDEDNFPDIDLEDDGKEDLFPESGDFEDEDTLSGSGGWDEPENDVSGEDTDEDSSDAENASWLYESESSCRNKNRVLKAAVVVLSIVFVILLALLAYTLFMKPALARKNAAPAPAAAVSPAEPAGPAAAAATPAQEKAPEPQEPQTAQASEQAAPPAATAQAPEAVPAPQSEPEPVKKAEDVRYRIKWGDTLWDISGTYYRTPWLYKKIARDNKIKNPDLIYAGSYLTIKAE